jgi:hypothetical protein
MAKDESRPADEADRASAPSKADRTSEPDEPKELEALRSQKEQLELKAQIAALSAPWWRRTGLIAGVTAILAAVLPLKTAIEESFRNDRELALQQAKQQEELLLQQTKQEHEIRMAYLDRYEVPGHRLQTLRFLIATTTDPRLLAWAQEERKIVQEQLDKIEQKIIALAKKIEHAQPGKEQDMLNKELDELKKLKEVTTLQTQAGAASGSAAQ